MSTVNLTKSPAQTVAPLTKISSRITVEGFEIQKVKFGYGTKVLFGLSTTYVEMGSWFRLGEVEFFAFTRKGLRRKVEAARERRTAVYCV